MLRSEEDFTKNNSAAVAIRECTTIEELTSCVDLQRRVFALPEIEISPVRHFVVTKNAGGFALGAFADEELVGFVLSVPAFLRGKKAFYSHMTAVRKDFQSVGVGARLKWAQRERALSEGVKFVKWTFEPGKARNAYFNLEKLGATVHEYRRNFYGTDYSAAGATEKTGLESDRLFAEWHLESNRVKALASGSAFEGTEVPVAAIRTPMDWNALVDTDLNEAISEIHRLRAEFEPAFADGLICRGFDRHEDSYLLFRS